MAASLKRIVAKGAYSWAESLDVVEHFGPIRRHAASGIDPLRITFALDGGFDPVGAAIRPVEGGLDVEVEGTGEVGRAVDQVARIFSLDHDGRGYDELGRRDPAFGALQAAKPGLRPVCFTSPYECASWGVISQRISMRQAAVIQDRLIERHGERLSVAGQEVLAFPPPHRLLGVDEVPSLPPEKIERLHAVARAALDGLLDVSRLRDLGDVEGPKSLLAIRGIGPFWASGIYLRACGSSTSSRTSPFPSRPSVPFTASAIGRRRRRSPTLPTNTARSGCGRRSFCVSPRVGA